MRPALGPSPAANEADGNGWFFPVVDWALVALGSFGCCGDVSLIQFDCSVGAFVRGQGVLCKRRRGVTRRRFLLGLYLTRI